MESFEIHYETEHFQASTYIVAGETAYVIEERGTEKIMTGRYFRATEIWKIMEALEMAFYLGAKHVLTEITDNAKCIEQELPRPWVRTLKGKTS